MKEFPVVTDKEAKRFPYPYVKYGYYSKTPDGKMSGYCKRSKLPKGLATGEIPKQRRR